MNNNSNLSVLYSWPAIIIAFVVFWPVGLFLLIKRISMDKVAAMGDGKIMRICGYVAVGIAVLGFLAGITDGFEGSDFTMILFFGGCGFALIKMANNIRNNAKKVKQYLAIIVNGNTRRIDEIAAATGKPYHVVKDDVQKMIDKGYLKNAFINESTGEIVLGGASNPAPAFSAPIFGAAPAPQSMPEPKVVKCPCCGANNTIMGNVGECEYCGSPLE